MVSENTLWAWRWWLNDHKLLGDGYHFCPYYVPRNCSWDDPFHSPPAFACQQMHGLEVESWTNLPDLTAWLTGCQGQRDQNSCCHLQCPGWTTLVYKQVPAVKLTLAHCFPDIFFLQCRVGAIWLTGSLSRGLFDRLAWWVTCLIALVAFCSWAIWLPCPAVKQAGRAQWTTLDGFAMGESGQWVGAIGPLAGTSGRWRRWEAQKCLEEVSITGYLFIVPVPWPMPAWLPLWRLMESFMELLSVSVRARHQKGCKVEKYTDNISNQLIHSKYYNKANKVKYNIVSHKHELQ